MPVLTKGVYGNSGSFGKPGPFGLMSGAPRVLITGRWYNIKGESIGWGHLSLEDIEKLVFNIDMEECFLLVPDDCYYDFGKIGATRAPDELPDEQQLIQLRFKTQLFISHGLICYKKPLIATDTFIHGHVPPTFIAVEQEMMRKLIDVSVREPSDNARLTQKNALAASDWFDAHATALSLRYKEAYVAVTCDGVIAFGEEPSVRERVSELRKQHGSLWVYSGYPGAHARERTYWNA